MGRVTSRASRATSAHSFLEARDTGVSTSFRRFARGLVLVALLLPACGTVQRERTPAETEALLQSVLARVAADDALELWSPASASASATFLATAREQADLVRSLFEAPVDPPIRVYLVPTAMDERKDARGLPNPASQGGKEGGRNVVRIHRGTDVIIPEHLSKDQDIPLKPGDRVEVLTPGGGGYGNPLERDAALVARDVGRGYYTAEQARTLFGVVIDAAGTVDHTATRTLRAGAA